MYPASHQAPSSCTSTNSASTLTEADDDFAKYLNGNRFCIHLNVDAPLCTGGKEIPPEGLEHSQENSGETQTSRQGGIKSGNILPGIALNALELDLDPDLAVVVEAWSHLPPAIRAGVMALVEASDTSLRNDTQLQERCGHSDSLNLSFISDPRSSRRDR